jgi:hypothetical protein
MNTIILRRLFVLAAVTVCAGAAQAQFVGDVFFETPSLTAKQGEAAEFKLQTFAGAQSLGAFHVELSFNATELEVQEITPNGEFARVSAIDRKPGVISIVGLNGTSLTEPIGTVALATIKVKALVDVGKSASLSISVKRLLTGSSAAFAQTKGYSGSVLVTPASSLLSATLVTPGIHITPSWWALGLPRPLAPAGMPVLHHMPLWTDYRVLINTQRIVHIAPGTPIEQPRD